LADSAVWRKEPGLRHDQRERVRVTTDSLDAIVLAGGINRIPLFPGYQPGYKALLALNGKASICYVLDALEAVSAVRRVAIVGSEPDLRPVTGDRCDYIPGGETLLESIVHGLTWAGDAPYALFTTADLPLVTPEAISDFLAGCARCEAPDEENAFLALCPASAYTGLYARTSKTFNHFRDQKVCHGNLALVDPRVLRNELAIQRLDALYNARKNAVRCAMAIGWRIGLSYALGVHLLHALTLTQMAQVASRHFGVALQPVLVAHPGITVDIDEPADYAFVLERLREGAGG
jgi:molybdopterin-guanine dinucleotide biosynthesis protein A